MKTKYSTEKMAKKLSVEGHNAVAIHGDLQHRKRERVIKAFRAKKYKILVATDVASRGLDIPHIEHVINHDLPQCPEDYLHRIGRTARAGAEGEAICFISNQDKSKWDAINRLMNPDAKPISEKSRSDKSFKGRERVRIINSRISLEKNLPVQIKDLGPVSLKVIQAKAEALVKEQLHKTLLLFKRLLIGSP